MKFREEAEKACITEICGPYYGIERIKNYRLKRNIKVKTLKYIKVKTLPRTQKQASDFGDSLVSGSEGRRAEKMCWGNEK